MHGPTRRTVVKQIGGALALSLSPGRSPGSEPASARPARIKVGQIGVGHGHANKLAVFRRSPDYEVVGIVEPDDALRRRAEGQEPFQGVPWLTRAQLLNTPGLQLVLVETRVHDLLDNAEVCIAAGKHVHLDKPAGESLAHYQRILQAAETQKLIVQMGYMFRYNPGVVLLRDLLKRGWLGDVFEVHALMSKVVDPASRRELAEYPGGIMFELGCHVIDLVVGMLGKPVKTTAFPRHSGSVDDGLADNMLAVFEYPKTLASVKASALEVDGGARRHLVVCGTGGTLQIQPLDNPSVRLTLAAPRPGYKAGYQEIRLPKYTRYVDDAADLARVIRGEKTADFSYEHDLAVQRAVLEASGVGKS